MIFKTVSISIIVACLCYSALVTAQSSGTDIFIADVLTKNGTYLLSNHRNITDRDGYDNQPFFMNSGEQLFYTSALTANESTQTDVILFNLRTNQGTNISQSEASEYSPTLMSDQMHYSMIRVAEDGKQKLWSYPLKEGKKRELLKDVEPVGYHAWINETEVMLFVLGEPHRLEIANTVSGKSVAFDKDIGASLFKIPNTQVMSYTRNVAQDKAAEPIWQLTEIDPVTKNRTPLTQLPSGAYYYAWSPDKSALAAQGSKLMRWHYSDKDSAPQAWVEFADVSPHCPKGVSRLAMNPQQTKLAYVCDR